MNIGGHIKANGLLTKKTHTRHLPKEDQVGGFPTITLIEEDPLRKEDPLEEDILVEDPLIEEDPLEKDILV